jgi:hypothetical protein
MGSSPRHRWSDLRPLTRILIIAGAIVQFGLLGAAQADIRRRDPNQLNGPRWLWVAVSFINFVGPIAYFVFGRRKATSA